MNKKVRIFAALLSLIIVSAALISCNDNNIDEEGSLGENPFLNNETTEAPKEDSTEGNTNQYGLPIVPLD